MIPGFLRHLGLDTDASERDIKRAYAERLKAIDQAADPDAFARLREAFEAARAWSVRKDERHATSDETNATPHDDAPDTTVYSAGAFTLEPVAPPAEPSRIPSTVQADADRAMETLGNALLSEPDTPASELLARAVAFIATCQFDARQAFEARLADAIATQRITRRAGLFPAAMEQFAWHQADGRGRGDQRDAWIERAVTSFANWQAFPEKRRKVLLPWLKQAAREGETLSLATVQAWPRVAAVMPYAGEYVRLRVDDAAISQWKAAFDALPPGERGKYRDAAWDPRQPDIPAWKRIWSHLSGSWWWWIIIAKAVLLALQAIRR